MLFCNKNRNNSLVLIKIFLFFSTPSWVTRKFKVIILRFQNIFISRRHVHCNKQYIYIGDVGTCNYRQKMLGYRQNRANRVLYVCIAKIVELFCISCRAYDDKIHFYVTELMVGWFFLKVQESTCPSQLSSKRIGPNCECPKLLIWLWMQKTDGQKFLYCIRNVC